MRSDSRFLISVFTLISDKTTANARKMFLDKSTNNRLNFTNQFELSRLPMIIQIISSGICGPIIEELIFRGIIYKRLKMYYYLLEKRP